MQWSHFLVSQPPEDARALVNDLTLGYSMLTLMVRQLVQNGELRGVVAALGPVELALGRACRRLSPAPDHLRRSSSPALPLRRPRAVSLTAPRTGDGSRLLARLQDVTAEARVSSKAIEADGSVDEISKHLGAALSDLEQLRAELTSQT